MEEQIENAILAGFNEEDIEILILHNVIGVPNEPPDDEPIDLMDLNELSDVQIKQNFRFTRNDLPRLRNCLGIPDEVITENGNHVDGLTALCMLLRRLCYPNRLTDLKSLFKCSEQSLSQIIRTTADLIIGNHGHRLERLNSHQWLNQNRYRRYAQSCRQLGAAIPNCWGFIDGTIRQICRPSIDQEEYYSGHKRVHCLKYQSVLCPDGIIVSLKGAYPGRRHDAGMFRESNLYQELEENTRFPNEAFVLYGDQAYGIRELLLSPFPGQPVNMPEYQIAFNNSMKVLRVAVEWGFQKISSLFAFMDFKKNQKLLLTDVETLYKCAVLLTNCHTCLYGSQSGGYFNVLPPGLEEYLGHII